MVLEVGTKANTIQGIVRLSPLVSKEYGQGFTFDPLMKNAEIIANKIIELGIIDKVIDEREARRLTDLKINNFNEFGKILQKNIK